MKKLDWNKIRNDHPNAFKALIDDHLTLEKWGEIDNPDIWDTHVTEEHHVMRHLFDFFDSKNLIITVEYCKLKDNKKAFKFDIYTGDITDYYDFNEYKDRPSCEIAAWLKAFDIFENKIYVNELLKRRNDDKEIRKTKEMIDYSKFQYKNHKYPLRYTKIEYPKHLIYIKDNKFNRDFMRAIMGEPSNNLGGDWYIEINLENKSYSYTFGHQWIYLDPPPLVTFETVRYAISEIKNK
jgi:hypothetical protein